MSSPSFFRKKSISQILKDIETGASDGHMALAKNLRLRDLIAMGIAAIIGAGIFSTIGSACYDGGPATILLFIFTGFACVLSALCYAQFASTIPISGSAYTYAYTTFGELVAWILGWNLLFEYAIGNITVALSWQGYFNNLLEKIGMGLPSNLLYDLVTVLRGHHQFAELMQNNSAIPAEITNLENVWNNAPHILGLPIILPLPAILMTLAITFLIIKGIKESKIAGNIMVAIKLIIVLMVISIGIFYVSPKNWTPFMPNSLSGVLKGVSAVFFAYIGFDAISTTAEECNNPQRDLPKAMIYCIIICTILYVLITLVLTGIVSYSELKVNDPLSFVFNKLNMPKLELIVSVSAVVAMTSVFLVFQLGQPRIWMSMARDGLLPKRFGKIHPIYQTPAFASIVAAALVIIPALFLNFSEVTDLCSIGTLFAFAIVCGGVLIMDHTGEKDKAKFKVPYLNGKIIVPLLFFAYCVIRYQFDLGMWNEYSATPNATFGHFLYEHLPNYFFVLVFLYFAWLSFKRNLSLIPVSGLLVNLYLMSELGITNWTRFIIWCAIGFIIYFAYSYKHSKLAPQNV